MRDKVEALEKNEKELKTFTFERLEEEMMTYHYNEEGSISLLIPDVVNEVELINSIEDFLENKPLSDETPIGIFDDPAEATQESIFEEWKRLRQKWNPKNNKNPIAKEIYEFINSAYRKAKDKIFSLEFFKN